MSWRARLLSFMRVPHAPSAPAGDQDVRIFRAAPNYFYYKVASWLLKNATGLIGLLVGVSFLRQVPNWIGSVGVAGISVPLTTIFWILEVGAIVGFATQAVWSLVLLRLDFEQRWYLVSDRSLRIREGIVRMHEKTMTFANIQHVTIKQGPLQRLLGISDLQVRTAGGGGGNSDKDETAGGGKHDLHIAYFHGVRNAAAIRETIRVRLRGHADAGLGDPDDVPAHARAQAGDTALLAAARALAGEARELRESLSARSS